MGGSSVQLEIKKNWKIYFIHYFITFLGEHSNVNYVKCAAMPLFLLLCIGIRGYLVLRFSGIFFFWIEGWVGGVYRIQTFLDFYIFCIFTRPLRYLRLVERDELVAERRREREETDRGPADEVGEHQESHPLGDTRVVGAPRLRGADRAVDLRVAADDDEERDAVEQHQETHKP